MRMLMKLLATAVLWLPTIALAQGRVATAGTYMLDGGSYTISVEMDGDQLIVHEPNKDSRYSRQADGSFQVYNSSTDTVYGIRVIDERTIEAFKPQSTGNAPSRLILVGRAAPEDAVVESADSNKWAEIANRYMERSQSDPANVQSWTACGAVAMKRSVSSKQDADAYASQMSSMLKQMDAAKSPCPEVFTF